MLHNKVTNVKAPCMFVKEYTYTSILLIAYNSCLQKITMMNELLLVYLSPSNTVLMKRSCMQYAVYVYDSYTLHNCTTKNSKVQRYSLYEFYFLLTRALHTKSLQITGLTYSNLHTVSTRIIMARVRSRYSGSNRLGVWEGEIQ